MTALRLVPGAQAPGPDERGVAAVEFALVVPLLVILLFVIVLGGGIYLDQLNLQAAARDAARIGSVQESQACTVAQQELAANSVGDLSCLVEQKCPTGYFRVRLTASRTVQVPLVGARQVVLNASSTYACSG